MEMLAIGDLEQIYRGRRVLVTGHTGFKGSWLALWLSEIGAQVIGASLAPPTKPNHWDLLDVRTDEHRLDIREATKIQQVVVQTKPECIFHLAAQPLVRSSYAAPLDTWSTNVMGTANVLEASRMSPAVRAVIVATTDKCYENRAPGTAYREEDRLGGRDPYSASKAATELLTASYRTTFMDNDQSHPLLATVRAGNVIGGGDWAQDRLIPDLVRARSANVSLAVRSPDATRPWQHVLDCLAGYLQVGAALLIGRRDFARPWNFGPDPKRSRTVSEVLDTLQSQWPEVRWHAYPDDGPHEAIALSLDSTRARDALGWRPILSLDEALAATALWYRTFLTTGRVISRGQLMEYVATAQGDKLPKAHS